MGKKIRMKWRKLDIVTHDQEDYDQDKNDNLVKQHPFMKVREFFKKSYTFVTVGGGQSS